MPTELLEWVDPDGTATTLMKTRGATGRWMPPVAMVDDPVPGDDGSRFRSVRYTANQVVVPILLDGTDRADYRAKIRALALTLNPKRGEGKLRSTLDTEVRELRCRYLDGMGVAEEFPIHSVPTLLFRAPDPFWHDVDDTTFMFTIAAQQTWFPMLPLQLGASSVFGAETIVNDGGVEAWPVWTVTGPADRLILDNDTTGRSLLLDRQITGSDTITIDTRPGQKTVRYGDGRNAFDAVTGALWPLDIGPNDISIEVPAATAGTVVTLAYRRRHLSA